MELFAGTEMSGMPDKFTPVDVTRVSQIEPFPVVRQHAYVLRVAQQFARRKGPLAEKYWRTECNRLRGRLQSQGVDATAIDREIGALAGAVNAILNDDQPQEQRR